tara:strand:+ start:25382 stop:27526 length:2145 start_codon:yes stop_codon:yes gene_type:complete
MEPKKFGNYTLLERVSHGGMAEVFRAKSFGEAGFEREVALKLLLPSMASDKEFVDMLIDEAKIAGQLNHANIAQIFDLGAVDGRYYIVQEFVQGQDLRAVLKRKSATKTKLKISTACHIAIKVCEGLHYAHNKQDHFGKRLNLVHRDISPHNILISNEGEVKIIDFGIAKADGRSTQTMAGLVKGKFAYMSPEQIRGLPVDHRSDVFATGILLHEMLTSRPLFQAGTEFETLKRARAAHADPPSATNPEVPPELDAIALKALARHVDDRYQSARELRDELWAFARANNAFAGHEQLTSMNPNAPQGDANLQIELASDALDAPAELLVSRAATSVDPPEEHTIAGEEFIVSEHTGPSQPRASSDYDDDPSENRTVVDPHFAGIEIAGDDDDLEEFDDDDFDAQWAADVGGPLSVSPSSNLATPGNHGLPRVARNGLEDETTAGGAFERPTDQFVAPRGPTQELTEDAEATERERRASTVPAMPSKIPTPAGDENPYAAKTTKRDRRMALAQTEPISKELLARAVGSTPASPASSISPADVAGPRSGALRAQAPVPQATAPIQQEQHKSAPAPMPQQQYGSAPAPMPQQQYGSAPAPQQHGSAPAPMPQQQQQYGSPPGQMPQQQYGSGPMQIPQPYGDQGAPQPAYGSPPPPAQYGSGAMPIPQPGNAPGHMPQGFTPQGVSGRAKSQGRGIFLLSALFFLLLAAAATITLVITE